MEWIKFPEQKPTDDGKYIVLNSNGQIVVKYWSNARDQHDQDGFGYKYYGCLERLGKTCVLYWTPLPEITYEILEEISEHKGKPVYLAEIRRLKERIKELETGET